MRRLSRREIEIADLDREIVAIEKQRLTRIEEDGKDLYGSEAESFFRQWASSRHGHLIHRGGWPDFVLIDRNTGKPFCVEVKSRTDLIAEHQARCFAILEKCGLQTFIWQPHRPRVLTPWRAWFVASNGFRPVTTVDTSK